MIGDDPTVKLRMHTHILDQSEKGNHSGFPINTSVSFFKNAPMYVCVHMCNAYVCGCQKTALGVINSGHLL